MFGMRIVVFIVETDSGYAFKESSAHKWHYIPTKLTDNFDETDQSRLENIEDMSRDVKRIHYRYRGRTSTGSKTENGPAPTSQIVQDDATPEQIREMRSTESDHRTSGLNDTDPNRQLTGDIRRLENAPKTLLLKTSLLKVMKSRALINSHNGMLARAQQKISATTTYTEPSDPTMDASIRMKTGLPFRKATSTTGIWSNQHTHVYDVKLNDTESEDEEYTNDEAYGSHKSCSATDDAAEDNASGTCLNNPCNAEQNEEVTSDDGWECMWITARNRSFIDVEAEGGKTH
ncbi:hypothetical protein BDW22DRAFT_1349530 [Trametopsis cervina]|nr:hypothetical protein BDW22DRAFT_1349530 [Trametopsis cervina]